MTLRTRLLALGAGGVVAAVVATSAAGAWQSRDFANAAGREVDQLVDANLDATVSGTQKLVVAQAEAVQDRVRADMRIAQRNVADAGGIHQGDGVEPWDATNQITEETVRVTLPRMYIGGTWLGHNTDPAVPTPVLDGVTELTGASTTVFERMNEAGDMLRVATTVRNAKGARAVGTFVPAVKAGKPNPLTTAVLAGKPFTGVAWVVDQWFVTTYEPIKDAGGRVVGMYFVGIPQAQQIKVLRKALAETQVGSHGSVAIVDTAGGTYVVAPKGAKDGDSITTRTDTRGKPYLANAVGTAAASGKVEMQDVTVNARGADRLLRLHTAYYKPWDWTIAVAAEVGDFDGAKQVLADGRGKMLRTLLELGVLVALVGAAIAWRTARNISRRVSTMTDALDAVASKDLTVTAPVDGDDELARMGVSLNAAVGHMRTTLETFATQSSAVASASGELSRLSTDLAAGAEEAAAQASSVSSAADEVSANISGVATGAAELDSSIGEIASNASSVVSVAREASTRAAETNALVAELGDASAEIGEVVALIDAIAKQTNLLALNATIEAARAGESGKGFAVVAHEVKELAAQTASATAGIADRVGAIQQKTHAALDAVGSIAGVVDSIAERQTVIASAVEEQNATTSEIGRSVHDAATGSESISRSVAGIADAASESTRAAASAHESAEQLEALAAELDAAVHTFRY